MDLALRLANTPGGVALTWTRDQEPEHVVLGPRDEVEALVEALVRGLLASMAAEAELCE